jgi:hypothetical protein
MILAAFKIQRTERGVAIEQVALSDQTLAHPEERVVAGVMDIALKATMEFVGKNAGKGTMIEGKDIEDYVNKFLEKEHKKSFQTQLKELGINVPKQR